MGDLALWVDASIEDEGHAVNNRKPYDLFSVAVSIRKASAGTFLSRARMR